MRITSSHGRPPRHVRILSASVSLATVACVLLLWALAVRFELVPRAYVPGVAELIGGFETFIFPDPKRNAFSYFAFPQGRGFWVAYGLTALRL